MDVSKVLSMGLLNMVACNEFRLAIVRVGRVKIPLDISFLNRREHVEDR